MNYKSYEIREDADGSKEWYLNGERHREDGAAVESSNGSKEWYLNGERHREDGPAIETADGYKSWFVNGKLHREDGPAIEWPSSTKQWYLAGVEYTENEFKTKLNPEISLTITGNSEVVNNIRSFIESTYKVKIS